MDTQDLAFYRGLWKALPAIIPLAAGFAVLNLWFIMLPKIQGAAEYQIHHGWAAMIFIVSVCFFVTAIFIHRGIREVYMAYKEEST